MLKKTQLILTFVLFLATACTRWDYSDPNMPEGLREYHQQSLNEALEILKENPDDMDALLSAGVRYQYLGDYKNAVQTYEKLLELDSSHKVALNNLADIYETMEKYDEAATYVKKLYALNQGDVEVIKDTVRILIKANEPQSAQEALDNFTKVIGSTDEETKSLIEELQTKITTSSN